MKTNKGFTLIELLVVIAIMVILMGIVLVAVNPGRQYKQARDAKRRSDVNAILNAINQYQVDNDGDVPTGMATCPTYSDIGTGDLDLASVLVSSYIAQMPVDPESGCNQADTCYNACETAAGRVTVTAPNAESGSTISVTR